MTDLKICHDFSSEEAPGGKKISAGIKLGGGGAEDAPGGKEISAGIKLGGGSVAFNATDWHV